jgi:drug/metabolite transporter (DMT)-like permease
MTSRHPQLPAIGLMLLAVLMFALMDAGLKLLSSHYPSLQVSALRGLSSLPIVAIWVLATVKPSSLLRVHWPLHLLRGVLGIAMMVGFVYGLRTLPLSTVYAITFVAPLLVTAMAGPILKEKIGAGRWLAIIVGLIGVLVVVRPTGAGMLTAGGLAILGAAVCYAAGAITVRVLAQRDSTQAMVFWFMVLLSLGAWLLALPTWKPLLAGDVWIIIGVGVTGSLAQVALTEAFRRGEASLIAPLEYSALLWGVMLDVVLWGVLPDSITWIGAAIIVVSGLYLLRREKMHVEAERP